MRSFPIPDWGDEAFNYPGTNINGETSVTKKPKKRKRKHDGDGRLEKGQPGESEAPQQAFKKKKTSKINTVPEKKKMKGTKEPSRNGSMNMKKEQGKSMTAEILSRQEENEIHVSELQTEVATKSLPSKRKKKKKTNNKYKELNKRQKEERMSQVDSAGNKSESKQLDIMKTEKSKEAFQANTSKEEVQASQAKEIKKKKNSKLLMHTQNNVPQENSTGSQKNNKDTSHQTAIQDIEFVNSHESKINSNHSLATGVGVEKKNKRKKSIKKPSDSNLSNSKETKSCYGSNSHQNVSSEKGKNKVKGEESSEGNIAKGNGLGSSVSIHKSEKNSAEDGTKKKKKKKEKNKENGNLLKVKDKASNSKKAKLDKQKSGGKSSKKIQESEEELVFDSNEDCSEKLKKDLGALLSSLNFNHFKTPGSGKEASNNNDDDDDESELEVNNRQEMSETKNHEDLMEWGSEGAGKSNGLTEKMRKKKEKINAGQNSSASQGPLASVKKGAKFDKEKVAKLLEAAAMIQREKPSPPTDSADKLKQRMEGRLMAARFRMVNQELYTKSSSEAKQLFKRDPKAFTIYHQGYQAQVCHWPVNPLDLIIKWLSKKPKEWVVADMGCGEATLAQQVPQSCVHSLDLVAVNPRVTACDMAHTPLAAASVDVVVFCLSLMGTNLKDFLVETNRVLRVGGIMKIAEVESRFGDAKEFEKQVAKYGFHCTAREASHQYFFLFEFKKRQKLKKTATLPDISLKPCLYKKR